MSWAALEGGDCGALVALLVIGASALAALGMGIQWLFVLGRDHARRVR